MKRPQILGLVAATSLAAYSQTAFASLVNITAPGQLPNLVTVTGKAAPLASQAIAEKPANESPATLFDWLKSQVPAGDPQPANTVLTSGTTTSLGDLSGYVGDYLVVHWGTGRANKFFGGGLGGFEQAFLIESGGLTSVTLTTPSFTGWYYKNKNTSQQGTFSVGGLSGWTIFDGVVTSPHVPVPPIPEPSTVLAGLLCLGVAGTSLLRRKS